MHDSVGPAKAGVQWLMLVALLLGGPGVAADDTPLADRVVIEKSRRLLHVYAGARPLATFRIALGRQPVGAKRCAGDNRTPEGFYEVSGRKENSDFHRALRLSYPSAEDLARAQAAGCHPGGDIMIHGLKPEWRNRGRLHRLRDWTLGCVAVTNEEIEQIWRMVPDGTRVEIRP